MQPLAGSTDRGKLASAGHPASLSVVQACPMGIESEQELGRGNFFSNAAVNIIKDYIPQL